ncbi:MAG TPA: hypothetical protein VFU41_08940 [Gemmatimonadales bacterium]|nr:hypothetical protein [Gemmatimonadales bacterium]
MATGAKDVWIFRIVHQDTGKPAPGVPVTVLDRSGNPAGYWVSEADGTVAIPCRDVPKLRLRVGLRNEEPIELVTATLTGGPIDLAAPTWLPKTAPPAGRAERGDRPDRPDRSEPDSIAVAPSPRPAEQGETPGHVLYFQRLVMFVERQAKAAGTPRDAAADFFALPADQAGSMRYGVLIEVEEYWQSLGVQWGELLYSISLTPGDEARLAVLDGRWRREVESRERPLQILARMVGSSMFGDLVTALRPELQLDPLTLSEPALEAAASDTVHMIRDRTERMSHALRRRPLGVVDANHEAPSQAAIRTVRNTSPDRLVTFHFFEPLERFRVVVRTPRVRPVIFVPFRLPNVATPDVVRRFGYIIRRTLLERSLLPDLERLLRSEPATSRGEFGLLLDHIEANLLYYSTAIISAGDPAARHVALSKLRDPAGRPLTDVVENTVLGRVGNCIALPLRSAEQLPGEWRDALAAYAARPPRATDGFTVTIPHPGVWVSAQPHDLMRQETVERNAAG